MDAPPRYRQSPRKFARAQRRAMSRAETMLWHVLRDHRLDGHKFRRQVPIGPYIADFACLSKRLVVEADGRTHEGEEAKASDRARDLWFAKQGYRTLRLPDDLILGGLPLAIERISSALSA